MNSLPLWTHPQDMGYTAELASKNSDDPREAHARSKRKWLFAFLISLIFGVPTMIIMFVPPELMSPTKDFDLKELLLFLFASIIQVNITICICEYVCL